MCLFQRRKPGELGPYRFIKTRPYGGSLAVSRFQYSGDRTVFQPVEPVMVGYAVAQLPICQDDALIRRQRHCGRRLQIFPGAERACKASGGAGPAFLRFRKQDGQIGEIIVQNKAGRLAVPLPKGVA